jgi:membrane-associated phospholipid phosphatase
VTASSYILVAYAVATLPLALRAGSWTVVAAHVGVVALLIAGRNRAATWLPVVIAPLLYFALPDLMRGWAGGEVVFRDAAVLGWERALFGGNPAQEWAARVPACGVSELLHAGYLAYYGIIFAPVGWLLLKRDRVGARMVALALSIAFVACYVVFVAWPVQGPRYLWPGPPGICEGPVRSLTLSVLESGSSRGAAFPSSHVAVAVAVSLVTLLRSPPAGIAAGTASLLLALGAVYGGFHYLVDVLAGALAGLLAAGAAVTGLRRRGGRREDGSPHPGS